MIQEHERKTAIEKLNGLLSDPLTPFGITYSGNIVETTKNLSSSLGVELVERKFTPLSTPKITFQNLIRSVRRRDPFLSLGYICSMLTQIPIPTGLPSASENGHLKRIEVYTGFSFNPLSLLFTIPSRIHEYSHVFDQLYLEAVRRYANLPPVYITQNLVQDFFSMPQIRNPRNRYLEESARDTIKGCIDALSKKK